MAILRILHPYEIMSSTEGKAGLMRAPDTGSKGFKAGSVGFLLLALLLAMFSGDLLLVFAVGTGVGGVLLLGGRRNFAADQANEARSTVPVPVQPAALRPVPQRVQPVVRRPARSYLTRLAAPTRRMAVRPSLRGAAGSPVRGRTTNAAVTDPPSQTPVIQVLQ